MVQIPVFNASQTSSKIPGVPTGVANPTAAAVLPYQAMANVGETILNQGIRSYGQELDFKTKKYELDKNLQTQKYKLSKEKEIKEFEIREKYQLENYKKNENLKLTWQENRVKLQRETTIKNGLNDLTKIFHQMTTEAQNNPNTDSAMDAWDKGMNDAFENVKNGIKDEYTKKLFELEYNDKYVAERLTAVDSVDKNILQNNLIAFEDQVDTLKNEALYGSNGNIKTQAWLKLFGENSIFDQRHNKGNLKINGKPVLPHVYKEIIKKEVFETQGDLLSKNSPDRFLTLKENGYWNDKLSDTKIGDFTDQANRVLAAEQSAYLTDLRSQKTSFNSAVTDFTDPGNPDYFGNLAQYDTMLNNGINLVQTLNAAGLKNEAQSVLNSLKDLESAKLNHNVILDLKDQPLDVIRDNLKALKSLNQATSGTPDHDQRMIDLEPHIEKLVTYMESNIENNAIGIAESTGMQVPVLDFLEPDINKFAESAQGYNQFVLANTDKYQLPSHQFFREENLFKFKEVFDTGNKEEILTLVRNISLVAGTNSNDAFRQLGQKSPLFAHMGMMMMLNNGASTEATEMMVNGWIGSRNPDNAALVKNISEACEVEYWILEKVLAQSEDEIHAIINSLSREGSTWVNTPRRAMKWHQNIKTHLLSNVPVEFTICGGQWGLACNAIHFLDLVQWWTGETLLAVDTGHLDKGWIPSKRHGFFEIFGTITARFSNGSQATLTANGSNAPLTISVKQEGLNWIIREQAGEAERSDGLIIKGSMEFQSTIAQKIVEDILINGKCELPSLVESAGLHKPFLRDMLSHWNQCGDKKVEMLPIT